MLQETDPLDDDYTEKEKLDVADSLLHAVGLDKIHTLGTGELNSIESICSSCRGMEFISQHGVKWPTTTCHFSSRGSALLLASFGTCTHMHISILPQPQTHTHIHKIKSEVSIKATVSPCTSKGSKQFLL